MKETSIMDVTTVSTLLTLTMGLCVAQNTETPNNTNASGIVGRYLLHDRVIRQDQEFHNIQLKNGSSMKQKITKMELIDIIHDVPDDENYVISTVLYKIYSYMKQLHGREKRRASNKEMLLKLYKLAQKNMNNKVLSTHLQKIFKLIVPQINKMDVDRIQDKPTAKYFRSIIEAIRAVITSNVKEGRMVRDRRLLVNNADTIIDKNIPQNKNARKKSEYVKIVSDIVKKMLTNERNQTIVSAIPASAAKATNMYDLETQKEEKTKVFNMIIRTLGLLDYRLEFPPLPPPKTTVATTATASLAKTPPTVKRPEEMQTRPSLQVPLTKPPRSSISIKDLPEIPVDSLRTIVKNTRSNEASSENVFKILMKAIEREERRKKLRSLYPEQLLETIQTNEGQSSMKNKLKKQYRNYDPYNKGTFDIEKLPEKKKNLFDRFENDVLDTLQREKAPAFSPKDKTALSNDMIHRLNHKDFSGIKTLTLEKVKPLAQKVGLKVSDENFCIKYNQCLNTTKRLEQELSSIVILQRFVKYRNEKLYNIKFASNIISNKTNRNIHLYKTWDAEYENNHKVDSNLPEALNEKRYNLNRMLTYFAFLRRYKKEKTGVRFPKKTQKIFFNVNPMKPNSILYSQNVHDMGFIISLNEFTLIDASITNYIELENINPRLVKEFDVGGMAYINKGSKLPGNASGYITQLKLEFITPKKNVKVWLSTKNMVEFACFSAKMPMLKISISGEVKGVNYNGEEQTCKKYEWKLCNIVAMDFDPNAFIQGAESLATCNN